MVRPHSWILLSGDLTLESSVKRHRLFKPSRAGKGENQVLPRSVPEKVIVQDEDQASESSDEDDSAPEPPGPVEMGSNQDRTWHKFADAEQEWVIGGILTPFTLRPYTCVLAIDPSIQYQKQSIRAGSSVENPTRR